MPEPHITENEEREWGIEDENEEEKDDKHEEDDKDEMDDDDARNRVSSLDLRSRRKKGAWKRAEPKFWQNEQGRKRETGSR